MSLDLGTIKIGADTSGLKALVDGLKDVGASMDTIESVSKKVNSAFISTKDAARTVAKSQKDLKQALKENEGELTASEKVAKKLTDQLGFMSEGFSSAQARILTLAKSTGSLTPELEKTIGASLKLVRVLQGGDPFDNSTGSFARMANQIRLLNLEYEQLNNKSSVSSSEIGMLDRAMQAAAVKAGLLAQEAGLVGAAFDSKVNKAVKDVVQEFNALLAVQRQAEERNRKAREDLELVSSSLEKSNRLLAEKTRLEKILIGVKSGQSRNEAERFADTAANDIPVLKQILALEKSINDELQREANLAKQVRDGFSAAMTALSAQQKAAATMMDGAVAQFRQNQAEAKRIADGLTNAFDTLQKKMRPIDVEFEKIKFQIENVGKVSKTTVNAAFELREQLIKLGKTEAFATQQMNQFIRARNELEKLEEKANGAGKSLKGLATVLRGLFPALGALAAGQALFAGFREAINAADAMTLLRSRINLVIKETEDYNDVQNRLLNIANDNRVSLEDTGVLFTRLAVPLSRLGKTTDEVLAVTDSFGKMILLSGANVREASAAITQFAQAMASGKLAGDEFRTIAEALPAFLPKLADAFNSVAGTTEFSIGKLRELSKEGLLTTDVISNALIVMNSDLANSAQTFDVTVGQAFQRFKNIVVDGVDDINQATGATSALAKGIEALASGVEAGVDGLLSFINFVKTYADQLQATLVIVGVFTAALYLQLNGAALLTKTISALTAVKGAYATATGVATAATNAFSVALARNPLGLALLAATAALTAYMGVTAVFQSESEQVAESQKKINQNFNLTPEQVAKAREELKKYVDTLSGANEPQREFLASLIELSDKTKEQLQDSVNAAKGLSEQEVALIAVENNVHNLTGSQYDLAMATALNAKEQADLKVILDNSVKNTKSYEDRIVDLTRELNQRTMTTKELFEWELNLLRLKEAQIQATMLEVNASKQDVNTKNEIIAKLQKELELLQKVIGLEIKLFNTPKKPTGGSGRPSKEKSEYDKLIQTLDRLEEKYEKKIEGMSEVDVLIKQVTASTDKMIVSKREEILSTLQGLKSQEEAIETYNATKKAVEEKQKAFDEMIKSVKDSTKTVLDEVAAIEEETVRIGMSEKQIREREIALVDGVIATKEAELASKDYATSTYQEIDALEEFIDAQKRKSAALRNRDVAASRQELIEANAKIAKQLEDDIVKAFEKSFLEGADLAEGLKRSIKATFAKEVFRIIVQPVIGGIVGTLSGALGLGGSGGSGQQGGGGSITGLIKDASNAFSGGGFGASFANDAANFSGSIMDVGFALSESTNQTLNKIGDSLVNNSEILGKVSAGLAAVGTGLSVFDSLKNGQYGSAIGEGVGYYFGGAIGGAIGKTLGGFVDKIFGFGGKISATALPSTFGQGVVEDLNKQYSDIVSSLGGTALGGVSFGAGGNTGRQGQNPNFTIDAAIGGRGVFNSANTREGQADGLFLSGEIALNEANLADQSLRALFSVLKETDFADNIDAVIDSVDTFGDSFENLQMALADAQLLKTINEEFPKLGGALATLAGQSIETVKTFVLLAGGFENLKNLQNAYISAIYSEEEKLALATQNLETAFTALGIAVPATTAEYKALVDAQNLTTVEGQATYVALLQLAGAFKEVKDAQQQALEEQIAEQERLLEEQQRAAEEAAEALRELADAYDEVRKKTQDYIAEITGGALSALERNARSISEVTAELNSEQDAMERIRLEGELSDLIFDRYQLEKEQIEQLQAVLSEVFSAIQTEADSVSQARDTILGVQNTTGSSQSIAQRIAQATGGVAFNATAAQANLTAEIERFKTSSLNAVSVLGKLREETVRYYEQQKALSELMKGTASSIRASISQVQFADLTPQQQLQNLEAQFAGLYATALTSSGSTLANTGAELQSLIGPLLEKASEIYASGPEFQRIKELVLGQAGTVADKLDALAPENYQQESLSLLDQIDQSLIGLTNQADLANQALIASLETASDRAVAALNNLAANLINFGIIADASGTTITTQPVLNGPTASLSNVQFSGGGSDSSVINFDALVSQLEGLREDLKAGRDASVIQIVTTDGKVLIEETLQQIKNRSKRGETVIFADGVK